MQPKVKHVEGNLDRRVRACLGGNLDVGITGERTSPVATMSQCKILANSVISDPKSFWMSLDLKNFFLKTKLEKKAYFRTHISKVPKKTVEMYNLSSLADSRGFLLAEVSGGMYGHPQAGKFAYEGLRAHLAQNGFHSKDETPCIFANADYSIVFAVIVDDFAVKVRSKEDGQLLINILEKKYEVKVDWSGRFYNGVEWVFQYEGQRSLKICMPGYIKSVLKRFACTDIPGVHTPAIATVVKYSHESQMMAPDEEPILLDEDDKTTQQEIVGVLLWYARVIHYAALLAVSEAASCGHTKTKADRTRRLLAYFKQYPDAHVVFYPSDMILTAMCDASFASLPDGRSRGGICYSLRCVNEIEGRVNGMIECICKPIKLVLTSAAESEYVTVFYTAEGAIPHTQSLEAIGHKQPATLIRTDNRVAVGIANKTMQIKRSRTINTKFHWIRERVGAGQFIVEWVAGEDNIADAFTKPLPRARFWKFCRLLNWFPKLNI